MPFLGVWSFSVQPQLCLWISARGWGCRIRFIRFKGFSRHLSRGWADMKLHPFLVYIGIMISSWACGQLILKDMKKFGFLIISFLLTSVCVLGQTKPQDQHTMDYIGQRILAIYKDAFNNPTTSFKKYFTTELYTLCSTLKKVWMDFNLNPSMGWIISINPNQGWIYSLKPYKRLNNALWCRLNHFQGLCPFQSYSKMNLTTLTTSSISWCKDTQVLEMCRT